MPCRGGGAGSHQGPVPAGLLHQSGEDLVSTSGTLQGRGVEGLLCISVRVPGPQRAGRRSQHWWGLGPDLGLCPPQVGEGGYVQSCHSFPALLPGWSPAVPAAVATLSQPCRGCSAPRTQTRPRRSVGGLARSASALPPPILSLLLCMALGCQSQSADHGTSIGKCPTQAWE